MSRSSATTGSSISQPDVMSALPSSSHAETGLKETLRCDGIRRVHFRPDGTPYFGMSAAEDLPANVKGIAADCPFDSPVRIIRDVAKKNAPL